MKRTSLLAVLVVGCGLASVLSGCGSAATDPTARLPEGMLGPDPDAEVAATRDPAEDFTLPILIQMGPLRSDIVCATEAGATDGYDRGIDVPNAPGLPFPPWVRGYFHRPEWRATFAGIELVDFMTDVRGTLLTGGKTKTWDFVVQVSASGPEEVTISWDTSELPAGVSAQMLDAEGVAVTSPLTFRHPGGGVGVRLFQVAVTAS